MKTEHTCHIRQLGSSSPSRVITFLLNSDLLDYNCLQQNQFLRDVPGYPSVGHICFMDTSSIGSTTVGV